MIERYFKEIHFQYERGWIHVKADQSLHQYLEQKGKRDAYALADRILKEYKKIYGKALDISVDSLAVQILVSANLDKLAKWGMQAAGSPENEGLKKKLEKLTREMEQKEGWIDCGDGDADKYRKLFDSLVPMKKMIYWILD